MDGPTNSQGERGIIDDAVTDIVMSARIIHEKDYQAGGR